MDNLYLNDPMPVTGADRHLDSSRREIRIGAMIAGGFFIGLLGWAALTPLDAGATAQGVVAVSGNRQAVQHRDGGIVTVLNVVEGQAVRKGDVLLKISASELVAAERGLTGEYMALVAQRESGSDSARAAIKDSGPLSLRNTLSAGS